MKLSILLGIALIACLRTSGAEQTNEVVVASLQSISGRSWRTVEWCANERLLKSKPTFNPLKHEVPLSVSNACSIAMDSVAKKIPGIKDWQVESVYLRPIRRAKSLRGETSIQDAWFYQITIVPTDENTRERLEQEGREVELCEVILLDGTIILPRLAKGK
jgi:hypothetical protein